MALITYADCHALRHAMERLDAAPDDWVLPDSELWQGARYVMHLRCYRCEVERHVAIDYRGKLLVAKYDHYPDDYLRPAGEGRLDFATVRLQLVKPKRKRAARR